MRTINEEEVDLSDYQDYHEAYQQIGQFLEDVYMRKRVHSTLNYLTPAEFERQWFSARKVGDPAQRGCYQSALLVSNSMGSLQATDRCASTH